MTHLVIVVAATGTTEAVFSTTTVPDAVVDVVNADAGTTGDVIEVFTSSLSKTVDVTTAVAWDFVATIVVILLQIYHHPLWCK